MKNAQTQQKIKKDYDLFISGCAKSVSARKSHLPKMQPAAP
jgi:hypothetical protein